MNGPIAFDKIKAAAYAAAAIIVVEILALINGFGPEDITPFGMAIVAAINVLGPILAGWLKTESTGYGNGDTVSKPAPPQ